MDINGYLDLIPTENYRKPKFMGMLETIIKPVMDLQYIASNSTPFDVRTAVGNQLDTIGRYVSVSRSMPYVPATGEEEYPDDTMRMLVRMRISQEAWDGSNADAARIYQYVVGDAANITYEDVLDGNITVKIGADSVEVAQAIYATNEILAPAGVGETLEVEAYQIDIDYKHGMAIVGMAYENVINLARSE